MDVGSAPLHALRVWFARTKGVLNINKNYIKSELIPANSLSVCTNWQANKSLSGSQLERQLGICSGKQVFPIHWPWAGTNKACICLGVSHRAQCSKHPHFPKPVTRYLSEAVPGNGFTPKELVPKVLACAKTRTERKNFQASGHWVKVKTRLRLQFTCRGSSPIATFHLLPFFF